MNPVGNNGGLNPAGDSRGMNPAGDNGGMNPAGNNRGINLPGETVWFGQSEVVLHSNLLIYWRKRQN